MNKLRTPLISVPEIRRSHVGITLLLVTACLGGYGLALSGLRSTPLPSAPKASFSSSTCSCSGRYTRWSGTGWSQLFSGSSTKQLNETAVGDHPNGQPERSRPAEEDPAGRGPSNYGRVTAWRLRPLVDVRSPQC